MTKVGSLLEAKVRIRAFKANALLVEPVARGDGAPMQVPLAAIDFDPEQPRRKLDPAALEELAASTKQQGVLEPVSLRRNPEQVAAML